MILSSKPGGMAEWLKAAVLKTVVLKGTVGSNPTPSATFCGAKCGEISPICKTNWRIRKILFTPSSRRIFKKKR